jgi:hypothetical protein
MNKSWLLLAGVAAGLTSCVVSGNVEVFSAFNLNAAKVACVASSNPSVKELNLTFNYTGTLRGLNMTFTPYQKPAQTVTISDIDAAPPAGFRIVTSTAGTAKLFLDLQQLNPTPVPAVSAQAIVQPNPQTIYPMDIQIEALGKTADAKIKLNNLTNVDVADCYPPKAIP